MRPTIRDRRWSKGPDGEKIPTGYEGGKPWMVRWHDHEGRRVSKSLPRRVDADRFASKVEAEARQGIDALGGNMTFAKWWPAYVEGRRWRQSTRDLADSHYRRHLEPRWGTVPLNGIRTASVQAWADGIADELAPATTKAIVGRFLSAMKAAVSEGVIARGVGSVHTPDVKPRAVRVHSPVDVSAIANEMPPRLRATVLVGAMTGARQGEVLGMTLDQVDFLRREWLIDRQMVTDSTGMHFGPPKSKASERVVPLSDAALAVLAEHLREFPADENQDGLVFVTEDGNPWRRSRFGERFMRARDRAGHPDAVFHELRHGFVSALLDAEQGLDLVAKLVGHETSATTEGVYAHLLETRKDRARAAVESAWSGTGVGLGGTERDKPAGQVQ